MASDNSLYAISKQQIGQLHHWPSIERSLKLIKLFLVTAFVKKFLLNGKVRLQKLNYHQPLVEKVISVEGLVLSE